MARKTLYPRLPGETAVDRLLNQTLPNLIQQREARIEREQARRDRLEQQRIQNDFTQQGIDFRKQEFENRQESSEVENVNLIINKAEEFYDEGNYDDAIKLLDRAEIKANAGKYTKDKPNVFNFDVYRDKFTKGQTIESEFNKLDEVFSDENSTSVQIGVAYESFMEKVYPTLSSGQREILKNKIETYGEGDIRFRDIMNPEYDMDSHNAILDAEVKYLKFTPDTLLSSNEFKTFKQDIMDSYTENELRFNQLTSERQQQVIQEQFIMQYGPTMQNTARQYLNEFQGQYVDSDEVSRYFNSLPEKQRTERLQNYARAVTVAEGVSGATLEKSLKDRGVPENFIDIAMQKSTKKKTKIETDIEDKEKDLKEVVSPTDISKMDEMQRYDRYVSLSKKPFQDLTEKENLDFVELYTEFSDPQKQVEMTKKSGQRARKSKRQTMLQERVDRNTSLYEKYMQLIKLGPSSGQGKEATYRAPKGMFSGGLIIKRKDLDARMTQLLDRIARDNTIMQKEGMEVPFLEVEL